MDLDKKHLTKKWEVSIMKLEDNGIEFKVTRRHSDLSVAETKFFKSKEEAIKQFEDWLK